MKTMKSHKINDLENHEVSEIQMNAFSLDSSMTKCMDEYRMTDMTSEKTIDENCLLQSDFESLPEKSDTFSQFVWKARTSVSEWFTQHSQIIKWITWSVLFILFTMYFIWSMVCKTRNNTLWKVEDNIRLLWISILIYLAIFYHLIRAILRRKEVSLECSKTNAILIKKICRIAFYVFCAISLALIVVYIIYTAVTKEPYNLVSIIGILCLIFVSYIFSTAPHMINWRPVLLGILLQFIFAIIILTTSVGYETFKFLGDRVTEFLHHTQAGAELVFGTNLATTFFAFKVLPIIVFLSSIMSVLYYLGVIQILVVALGTSMQMFMGTTCGESLNAAANIFLGMTESPLLIKPLLGRMTNSELHAIMTGGFATIAGSVLGGYIGFGAPANHLISASVMSAPAALAVSKLMCPETKKSKTTKDDVKNLPKSPYKNIVEATTAGASDSIPLVANIAVNLIAFVAILAFFNATLAWLGERACMNQKLSFEFICSYLFWPLALSMGVYIKDCRKIAELIGIKTFLNEFIAYERLGKLISNRKIYDSINQTVNEVVFHYDDILIKYNNTNVVTLEGGILMKDRSVVIATYALCGFANFGSMGILLSSLSAMIPHRRSDLSKLIVRAMMAGNIACFLTACIAGLFYKE